MTRTLAVILGLMACPWWGYARAQSTSSIPVRHLKIDAASDSTVLSSVSGVRHLPNGSVLVNDASRRQLVVFDSTLSGLTISADTGSRSEFGYGLKPKPGALIPYVADSSMFANNESAVLMVINPLGVIVNIVAPVRSSDLDNIVSGAFGNAAYDSRGRLVYGSNRKFDISAFFPALGEAPRTVMYPDSAPILRADFEERTVDTVAMIRIPVQKTVLVRESTGGISPFVAANPISASDDWTLLEDGTIAIVRVADYHIDWIQGDGQRSSTPPMPFDWRPISRSEKKVIVDSVKRDLDAATARDLEVNPPLPGQPIPVRLNVTVDADDIPDNYPPVRAGQMRTDMNDRVWILPSTSALAEGGLLYDVVNRQGIIIERVQLPLERRLAGFGPGNVVYLTHPIARGAILERAEIAR